MADVVYQKVDGQGGVLYPNSSRRRPVVAPGRAVKLQNEAFLRDEGQGAYEDLYVYGFATEADWQMLLPDGHHSPEASAAYVKEIPERIQAAGISLRRWTVRKLGYEIVPAC